MKRLALLAVLAIAVYELATWLAFRWLGNPDPAELSPAHRRLLDEEAW